MKTRTIEAGGNFPNPLNVRCEHLVHRLGTKEYSAIGVFGPNGRSVVVFQWGKIGTKGQIAIETFRSGGDADRAMADKIKAKVARGYVAKMPSTHTARTIGDLTLIDHLDHEFMSSFTLRFGDTPLQFLFGMNEDGFNDPDENEIISEPPARKSEPVVVNKVANPNWGMF